MKTKIYFLFLFLALILLPTLIFAQGVAINEDNSEADPSAMLDVKSNNKGILIPRMTKSGIEAIANPANGLMVFNTDDENFFVYVQSDNEWKEIAFGSGTINGLFICGDPLVDSRDGQSYATVQIGSQCWMAENLNIGTMISGSGNQADNGTIEKYCFDDNASNCDTYGGLYQWNEMMAYVTTEGSQGICPDGWHIPTDAEWCILENEADAGTISCSTDNWRGVDASHNMREAGTTHWASPNAGATNSTGFTLLPGGYYFNTSFISQTYLSFQWSSSAENGNDAWARQFYYNQGGSFRLNYNKGYGGRIRCVKD